MPDATPPPMLTVPPEAIERWTRQMEATEQRAATAETRAAEAASEARSTHTAIDSYVREVAPILAEWRAEQAARSTARANANAQVLEGLHGWRAIAVHPRVITAAKIVALLFTGYLLRTFGIDPSFLAAQDASPTAQEAPQ